MNDIIARVLNKETLLSIYQKWPNFHDAEIVNIELDRGKPSILFRIYLFSTARVLDANGNYVKENEKIVGLLFDDVCDVDIEGFNHQNVLSSISFNALENELIEVSLAASFGVRGSFICKAIEVVSIDEWKK